MKLNELALIGVAAATIVSCSPAKKEYASYELYPVRSGDLTEMEYTPEVTNFTLWAPTADEVRLMLFDTGDSGHAYETVSMVADKEGTWTAKDFLKTLLNNLGKRSLSYQATSAYTYILLLGKTMERWMMPMRFLVIHVLWM